MNDWINHPPLLITVVLLLLSIALNLFLWQIFKRHNTRLKAQIEVTKLSFKQFKSRFIANISHEIRTPLNAILGHAQLLDRDPVIGDKQRNGVTSIIQSSGRLSDMINDLLEIASIESNAMTLQTKDFDLTAMLGGLSDLFEKRCVRKRLQWQFDNHCEGGQHVHGDMGKVRQVLIKIIGNAVKYTPQGSVVLSVKKDNDNYQFTISDTGPGIDIQLQQTVFQAFERQQNDGGVGLGLPIAKSEIELMGGTLELVSTPGQGSCFGFSLKLPAAQGPVCQRTIRGQRVTQLATAESSENQPVRIFVIDRAEQTQEILSKMLQDVGIKVSRASNGEEALKALQNLPEQQLPKLVFYTIDIPLQNATYQLAQIQNSFGHTDMQFVVLCAAGLQGQIQTHLSLYGKVENKPWDFRNFIAKPYRFEAIYELVQQLLDITFEYQNEIPLPDAQCLNVATCYMPQGLWESMNQAAKDYEIGKLESTVAQLVEQDPNKKALAAHFNGYITHYDMDGLLRELAKVNCETEQDEQR